MATEALNVIDLGRMAYVPALEFQRETHARVLAKHMPPALILVEHDPVITVSQRREAPSHLLATSDALTKLGIDLQPTDRGGDITYHGPGQLVAYPILRLGDYGLNVGGYMRFLEQVVIDTLAVFNITAYRDPANTGVWVRASLDTPDSGSKICAIGVRVRRNVTLHGLALNVTTDLSHFETIIPCGLAGRSATSVKSLLGGKTPSMPQVKTTLHDVFSRSLSSLPGG